MKCYICQALPLLYHGRASIGTDVLGMSKGQYAPDKLPCVVMQFMTKVDAIIQKAAEPSFEGEDLLFHHALVPKTPI